MAIGKGVLPQHSSVVNVQSEGAERDSWLDWTRSFAIIAVVLTHCVESSFPMAEIAGESAVVRFSCYFLHDIGRLGVPAFLFLSGYLLTRIHDVHTWNDVKGFYRRKWLPLLICAEMWTVIYAVFLWFLNGTYSPREFFNWICFCENLPLSHWWYMRRILGIYLIFPILLMMLNVFGRRGLFLLCAMSFSCSVFRPIAKVGFVDLYMVGDYFLTYVLAGMLIATYRRELDVVLQNRVVSSVIFTLIAFNLGVDVALQMRGHASFLWYSDPQVITSGLLMVLCLYQLHGTSVKMVRKLSEISFAIYLVHNLFLYLFRDEVGVAVRGFGLRCCCLFLIAFGCSLLTIRLLSRYNWICERLFLIRGRKFPSEFSSEQTKQIMV